VALSTALHETQTILEDSDLRVTAELLPGHPAEALTNIADARQPDLIVVGAKGLRAIPGILLGSVAKQIVEDARWAVLVVRAPYLGLRRVLLVTDGSSSGQHAVDYLAGLPLPASAEVRVMHVLPPLPRPESLDYVYRADLWPAFPSLPASSETAEQVTTQPAEDNEREGQAILAQAVETLKAARIEAVGVLIRGDAATEIIEYLKKYSTDLVVAGSRNFGRVKGWLPGSISRRLVYYARCSVLVVKIKTVIST
jgi:nucleotide-binding universal stress UspA family protein